MNQAKTFEQRMAELNKWRDDRIRELGPDKVKLREIDRVFAVLKLAATNGYEDAVEEFNRQVRPMKSFKVMD